MERGGAGVDDDGLMGRDELSAKSGDGFFLGQLMGVSGGEREFVGPWIDDTDPPVGSLVIST